MSALDSDDHLSSILLSPGTPFADVVLIHNESDFVFAAHSLVLEARSRIFSGLILDAKAAHSHSAECYISRCKYLLRLAFPFPISAATLFGFFRFLYDGTVRTLYENRILARAQRIDHDGSDDDNDDDDDDDNAFEKEMWNLIEFFDIKSATEEKMATDRPKIAEGRRWEAPVLTSEKPPMRAQLYEPLGHAPSLGYVPPLRAEASDSGVNDDDLDYSEETGSPDLSFCDATLADPAADDW